ncbi:MAG: flagellar hook protein FlgE [Sinobacteraceae bacterium]|nr:flagellar hook protein FlgE [Nevskiaceae bacterium]MBV8852468.1 flagellar hook protein FlgE [Nevskiaceae bacterium]MBV9913517.1 flagellar hook protein FlgE [Nevskiaceae bacterium]
MSFNIALTGLDAANQDLSVTSNNLANVATTGFKGSRAEFGDLFASSQAGVSATAVGNGVAVTEMAQQFTQGNVETTGNNLDLAISGNGFFTLSQKGALAYTRDGQFQTDQNGNVITASGANLQVYPPLATGGFNTGGLQNLQLTTSESAPQATSTAQVTANLPANAAQPTTAAFSPTDPTSYNNTTSLTVYDSLGAAHTATMYFIKSATPNAWSTQLYVDGNAVGTPQSLTYSNTGALTAPANGNVTFPAYTPATGAAAMNMTFDFSKTTQYGDTFGVTAVQQDGFTTGKLTGVSIDSTGVVQARFTNGRSINLGQVAVANFANPQGLQQLGNATWAQTNASGAVVNGVAGNSGFGTIQSGSLEDSNVDTTAALVDMIKAQRNFQANAQMIQTDNQITQTVINIRQ